MAHGQDAHGRTPDLSHAQTMHGDAQQLDDVHEGEREGEAPVGTVDTQRDRIVPFGIQRHQLGRDPGRRHVVQRAGQYHHPLREEPLGQAL